uniref:Uncharacterized protein n=1 Tax=Anguilla anguilla TaxID=7936 RepID=A0A0E9PS25_ANGAN
MQKCVFNYFGRRPAVFLLCAEKEKAVNGPLHVESPVTRRLLG